MLLVCMFLTPVAVFSQDTLILNPTRKKPQGDTLIVKLVMVYFVKEISYIPYEVFTLAEANKNLPDTRKAILRNNQKEIDAYAIEKILYDEGKKHTIRFVYKNYANIERYRELRNLKHIVSAGLTYTSIGTSDDFEIDLTWGAGSSEKKVAQYLVLLQPTYERLMGKGVVGLRISPVMIGLNKKAIGAAIGGRFYFRQQRPFKFALGLDMAFVNSTLYRQLSVPSEQRPQQNNVVFKQLKRENKNELYVTPFVVQLSYTSKNNYYFSLDFSIGDRYLFANKTTGFNGNTYKYDNLPMYGQLRLNVGKKF